MKRTKLYRPVNKAELTLIQDSGWKKFPPRLPDQYIFYPVTNQEYGSQITTEWNLPSYKNGFVTEFELSSSYLSKFKVEKVGLDHHTELWVPAEDLEEFNAEIIGDIRVIEAYHIDPKIEFVFIEHISLNKKEVNIFFRFINNAIELNMNEKKRIGNLAMKHSVSLVRKTIDIEIITWQVSVKKQDFEIHPFEQDTIQEFIFK